MIFNHNLSSGIVQLREWSIGNNRRPQEWHPREASGRHTWLGFCPWRIDVERGRAPAYGAVCGAVVASLRLAGDN